MGNNPRCKFTHTIIYVDGVKETLEFFNKAFGLTTKFMHESGFYGELDANGTSIAFADWQLVQQNLGSEYEKAEPKAFELSFQVNDMQINIDKACAAGAKLTSAPQKKPWGQTVAYLMTPQNILIEFYNNG